MRENAVGRAKFSETNATWDDAIVAWAEHISRQVGSPRTAKRYADSLSLAAPFFRAIRISELGKDHINRFVAARRQKGVTNATIRRDLQAISSLLDFAEDEGWREGNPAQDKMRKLKERRDPITLPTNEDYDYVLSRLAPPYADVLRIARASGLRQGEICAIEWTHFHPESRRLMVRGKGNKQRAITLSEEASEIIERQPRATACPRVFHSGGKAVWQAAFVFSRARRTAQKAAQKDGRAFKGFRFHDMRHLYAVEALRKGGSIYALQQHLRHSSIKTTEIYLDFLSPDEKERAKRGEVDGTPPVAEKGESAGVTKDGTGQPVLLVP
ncbi:MAG: site-specific integrase [Pseudomonadota bacterium]